MVIMNDFNYMSIRNATYRDAPIIKLLLEMAGCKTTTSILINQLETSFGNDTHHVFVYEVKKEIVGFIVVHCCPQMNCVNELAFVTNIIIDKTISDQGIAKALESYITEFAKKRKCDQIHISCLCTSYLDIQFYAQQDYHECFGGYVKKLIYE